MNFLPLLKHIFAQPLPGWNAQQLMSPPFRDEQLKPSSQPVHNAAIGIIFFVENKELYILFIERSHDGGPHSGQIAFPGGAKDQNDDTLISTALREIHEETGISPNNLELLGPLTPLYIPVSRFMVYPFVFYTSHLPPLQINTFEIKKALFFPVSLFFNESVLSTTTIQLNGNFYTVPCYRIDQTIIWGATSMIWCECLTLLKPLIVP